jgi:hypothetical protein
VHLAFGLKTVTRASARDVSLRLGGALSWRSAVLALLGTTASRARGKPVAHRELDLAAVKPHVPQHSIVEPLELANGVAPALLGRRSSHESRTAQGEPAQPVQGRAHAALDEEIALDRGSPLEFEGREWQGGEE